MSLLILSIVQFILVRNTYELENDRYYFSEKALINESYYQLIRNDKLFPGGQHIIDSLLNPELPKLENLYLHDRRQFISYKQEVMNRIIMALREKESIRNFLTGIRNGKKITDSLQYALLLISVDVLYNNNEYVSIYSYKEQHDLIDPSIQEENGVRIGGELKNLTSQNVVTNLTVSSPNKNTYRINWRLYVEPIDRDIEMFRKMAFTYALSLFSFLIIVSLFLITIRNWLRQKKLSEMKSDFINNITHEFHTPLSAIIVANKSLQNDRIIEKKENIRPLSEIIQRQSDRLKKLISQVLEIVTMEKPRLQLKEHSIHHLLDEILLDYRLQSAENFNLTLNTHAQNDVVKLDQFHFTTIILNILENGLKYNNSKEKEIIVTTENDEDELRIIIRDNGSGMSADTLRHIFEKFYRHKGTLQDRTKGLGLGLYYVKQSVHAHHWHITVDSKPGNGSSFTIHIPFS